MKFFIIAILLTACTKSTDSLRTNLTPNTPCYNCKVTRHGGGDFDTTVCTTGWPHFTDSNGNDLNSSCTKKL